MKLPLTVKLPRLNDLRRSDRPRPAALFPSAGPTFYAGVLALLAAGFALGLYLGLPTASLKERIEAEALQRAGVPLQIGSLSLRFPPALRLDNVRWQPAGASPQLPLDRVQLRPLWWSLFSANPGAGFSTDLLGGSANGQLRRNGTVQVKLSQLTFFAPLAATSSLKLGATLRSGNLQGVYPPQPESESLLNLTLDGVHLLGLEALGADADRLELGTITLQASGRGSALKIERIEASGGALQLGGDGTFLLAQPLPGSRLNLALTLQPGANFDPQLRDLLSLFAKPAADGSLRLRLSGTLGAPRLQ
ncbi:MAG: type II secretion system protein GspN [Trichloromonadaceae bacterium]